MPTPFSWKTTHNIVYHARILRNRMSEAKENIVILPKMVLQCFSILVYWLHFGFTPSPPPPILLIIFHQRFLHKIPLRRCQFTHHRIMMFLELLVAGFFHIYKSIQPTNQLLVAFHVFASSTTLTTRAIVSWILPKIESTPLYMQFLMETSSRLKVYCHLLIKES